MIRTILIDDEKLNTDLLHEELKKYCPHVEVVATADTVELAVELIIQLKPDLIFLDIQIHNKNGFDVLDIINDTQLNVIMLTAYENYALRAIKYKVIDYLLKPINVSELINAVKKVTKLEIENKDIALDSEKRYITIHNRGDIDFIRFDDIMHIESSGSYSIITNHKNVKVTASKLMRDIEIMLPKQQFLRVHNSHIVNINFIKKILKTRNGDLMLEHDIVVPISASRKKEVFERIGIY